MNHAKARYNVDFIPNDGSAMSCFSASMCMMMNALTPGIRYKLTDVIKLSGAIQGKSAWPARLLIELEKLGFDTRMIEYFDAEAFIASGAEYLQELFGPVASAWQTKNSDIPKEQSDYKELLNSGAVIEKKIPVMADICAYLREGWLVKCTINSAHLNNKPGYVGHAVVVLSVDDSEVVIHNPGPPAHANQHVSLADFEAAWASPSERAKECIAIRPIQA